MNCSAFRILLSDQIKCICIRARAHVYVYVTSCEPTVPWKIGDKDTDWSVKDWSVRLSRFILTSAVADSCGEMRCVSKRLSRAKLPFPTSGERYARMMPPLSRWRTSENLPKNVTSVQRTVTEDFSEDWRANSALMPNAEDQRAPFVRYPHDYMSEYAPLIRYNRLKSNDENKKISRRNAAVRNCFDKQWGKREIKNEMRTSMEKMDEIIASDNYTGQNRTACGLYCTNACNSQMIINH